MQHRTILGILTATLVFSSIAAATYALCKPDAEIDLAVEAVGEPISVGLEPLLGQIPDGSASEDLPETIASAVITKHAQFINAPADFINLERSSRQTWSDSCLGLGGPAESCLFALTEGWQVTVVDNTDKATTYRTNLSGNSIRREPKNGEAVPLEEASPLPIDG